MDVDARRMIVAALRATALAFVVIPGFAQTLDPDTVHARHDAKVHSSPNANAPVVFSVTTDTDLMWVGRGERDGFYRVIRRDQGPQGWINAVDVDSTHKGHELPPPHACAATLQQCPVRGCEEQDTPAAESNEMKRRQPKLGVPVTLSFGDLAELQRQADELIGQGPYEPTAEQRAKLKGLQVKSGSVSEGDLVRSIGFIAKGSEGLHANKAGESVNCGLKKPSENDFHIPLVDAPGNSEHEGIVVEMIPQDRPPSWTIEALKEIQAKGLKVWVEGGLSYDKVHWVSADAANPMKDEPDRMSLWEIHPITKFLVCRQQSCDPQAEEDWTPL